MNCQSDQQRLYYLSFKLKNMKKKKKQVVLMGKGPNAIRAASLFIDHPDYDLFIVVPNQPHPTWEDSFEGWVIANKVPSVSSGHYKDIPKLQDKKWQPDLVVSINYNRIIKEWFIKRCKKIINMHNSPLPKYRGVSPINWALKNNESHHGVTIHEITTGIDDGPIISQVIFPIWSERDEVIDVYKRCVAFGWTLFEQTIHSLDQITPIPQDESRATYYSLKEDVLLGERSNFTRKLSRKTHGK